MTSFREARDVIFLSYDQRLTVTRSVCCCMLDSCKPQNLDLPYDLYTAFDRG